MRLIEKKIQNDVYRFIKSSSGMLGQTMSIPPISKIKAFYMFKSKESIENSKIDYHDYFSYIHIVLKDKSMIWEAESMKNQIIDALGIEERYITQISTKHMKEDFIIYVCLF